MCLNRHEMIDQRSLAMHREMAQMIRENPAFYDNVKQTLNRWVGQSKPTASLVLKEWQTIIETKTIEEVLEIICTDNENGHRLRQSSPFCILPEERRTAIFKEFGTDYTKK